MKISYFWATELGAGLLSQLQYLPKALLLSFLLIPAFLYFTGSSEGLKKDVSFLFKKPWLLLFFFYLSYLIVSTLLARRITYPLENVFDHFGFKADDNLWNAEIVQNTLLFIPYSFFFLQSGELKEPFKTVMTLCVITTCSIELLQLILWLGYFQLSDIFHNTLGGLIGWLLWKIIRIVKVRPPFSVVIKKIRLSLHSLYQKGK